jgi:hypothetical protein
MTQHKQPLEVVPDDVVNAVKAVSRCLDFAPLDVLEKAHSLVYDHYMRVVERSRGSFENASEQRVLGMLWAEIEMAIDERRTKQH